MKVDKVVKKLVLGLGLVALAGGLYAALKTDDPLTVAPNMYRSLFENEKVRVMEVTFKPGASIKKHSHPDHYVYAASGGKLKISKLDGTSSVADITSGAVIWIPAETHWAENVGTTEIKLIVNELKPSGTPTKMN